MKYCVNIFVNMEYWAMLNEHGNTNLFYCGANRVRPMLYDTLDEANEVASKYALARAEPFKQENLK